MASTLEQGQSDSGGESQARLLSSGMPSLTPPPMADQELPSHLAIRLTLVKPPAVVNSPPTKRSVPWTARARTTPLTPLPTLVQVLPVHLATYLMLELLAALVNS